MVHPAHPARPSVPPTPRRQVARVLVGLAGALVLGAAPAVAWDLTTQPPQPATPTPWPHPSPWASVGTQMKAAAGGLARVYLPTEAPPASSIPAPALPPPAATPTASYAPPPVHGRWPVAINPVEVE
ncbi:MAG TPA: hypothetical protein VGG39_06625 [Polyangiaceae bacterium]|jgi:hypothetical protein